MAKEKRSAADLDAELAALEAELAALEGKGKKKAKTLHSPAPARLEAPPAAEPTTERPTPAPEKKGRFAMPRFGRKSAENEALAVEPATTKPVPMPPPTHARTPAAASTRPETYDSSVWRQDGDAWIRTVHETPLPVMRRVLDENGAIIREETANARDVEEASGVKAERGLGKLLRRK